METKTKLPTDAILEQVEVKEVKNVKDVKKTQKPSATYTFTQMGNVRDKLEELGLITKEEITEYNKIREAVSKRLYERIFK